MKDKRDRAPFQGIFIIGGAAPPYFNGLFQEIHLESVDVDILGCAACGGGPTEQQGIKGLMIRFVQLYCSVKSGRGIGDRIADFSVRHRG